VRPTWMPAVLCEGMFIILPEQEAKLRSAEGQQRYASGVVEGLRVFLRDRAQGQPGHVGHPRSGASPKAKPHPSPRVPLAGGSERGVAP